MGGGFHGGFGNTRGSGKAPKKKIFTPIQYEGTVKVDGEVRDVSRRVYQRNDIDFEYVDPLTKTSNLDRMKAGNAPIGSDGKPVQLHHIIQKEVGPLVEIREVTHKEYTHILHGMVESGGSFRNDASLEKQFKNFKKAYWRWRANEYLKGKDDKR